MGGPWRERGFDPASLRSPRPRGGRAEVLARDREHNGLGTVVLLYILAVVTSFGLMVGLMHHGW